MSEKSGILFFVAKSFHIKNEPVVCRLMVFQISSRDYWDQDQ